MELRELGEHILFASSLEDKLFQAESLTDEKPDGILNLPKFPGRPSFLDPKGKKRTPFPKDHQLDRDTNRGAILHFFANHELLAMELMALALLKFPNAPKSFRMGIAETIKEEQEHMKLYMARMNELGVELGDIAVNDFFWNSLKTMSSPMDYVTGMSLTFEQANLDYCLHYLKLMNQVGDEATTKLLQTVYDDEIGHVKYGVQWFDRMRAKGGDQWQAFREAMHGRQPLTIARAKGIGFDRDGRLKAGLDTDFVEEMEVFSNPKGRCPRLFWYNADCELELGHGMPGYSPTKGVQLLMGDFEKLPLFVAKSSDAILCQKPPSHSYRRYLRHKLGEVPEFVTWGGQLSNLSQLTKFRSFSALMPWGWTPRAKKIEKHLDTQGFNFSPSKELSQSVKDLFKKTLCPELRKSFRDDPGIDQTMGPEITDGICRDSLGDVQRDVQYIHEHCETAAVIKSMYGFSGSGQCRIYPEKGMSDSQRGWVENQLQLYGQVLVEPWLPKVLDGSVIWEHKKANPRPTVFMTDTKGRYKGHRLGSLSSKIPEGLRPYFLGATESGESPLDQTLAIAKRVQGYLDSQGYDSYAGIDFFVYRWPKDQKLYVKMLCEINCRMTMGHVASAIDEKINKNSSSQWLTFSYKDIKGMGFTTVKNFAQKLLDEAKSEDGIFFTNDPETAIGALSCLVHDQKLLDWLQKQEN